MLELENVHVNIGDFAILRGVSLEVPQQQIVGLVGRNGAGKTTTLKSIMGLVGVKSGNIHFDGQDLVRMPAYDRTRYGIGYVPEDRRLIDILTTEENILLPAWAMSSDGHDERLELIYELMPEVKEFADRRAAQLSGGQQKMVALARALMSGTKLLLLDEPFEGLAPALAQRFAGVIEELRAHNLSVLVAESGQKLVGSLADNVYTIERGEILSD